MHRRKKRYGVAVLALSLVATVGAARANAADPAAPVLAGASVDQPFVAVSGLNVVLETVSVHLTDPDTICVGCGSESMDPMFLLPAAAFSGGLIVQLTLASGSTTDGVWTGRFPITTNNVGHLTLVDVAAAGGPSGQEGPETDIVPSAQGINVGVDVTATHASHISAGVVPHLPKYNSTITWKGRAYFPDTGAPIPNRTLLIGTDTSCGIDSLGNGQVTTDSRGYWSYTEKNAVDQVRCVVLTGTSDPSQIRPPVFAYRQVDFDFRHTVSIVLATTPVKLGTRVTVTGDASPPFGDAVLQRMVSGNWVFARSASVRESGRYTLYAQPPARGNWRYRVVVFNGVGVASTSKTVILGVY